jgi:hypothetical protein
VNAKREVVAQALYELLDKTAWVDPYSSDPAEFAFTTRRPTLPENVTANDQPYFGLELVDEEDDQNEGIALTKYTLNFRAYVYARADANRDIAGESLLNTIMDALDQQLQNQDQPGERQTLGGLIYHVWIEGIVLRSNGLVDEQMFLIVPIKAMTGI